MPMEDVDFLKKNSKRQSYMFLVDSASRDRRAYPQPSEYVVQFSAPFHNVIGLEVLHASIPRSMYNIDSFNNTLRFLIYEDTAEGREVRLNPHKYKEVTLTPGEYSIQTLLAELNRVLSMNLNNDSARHVASIIAETESTPPELTNKLQFRSPYPFAFDMEHSTSAEALGFDTYAEDKFASLSNITTAQPYLTIQFPSIDFLTTAIQELWSRMSTPTNALQLDTIFRSQLCLTAYHGLISDLADREGDYALQFMRDAALSFYDDTPRNLINYLHRDGVLKNHRVYRSVDLPPEQALGEATIIFEGPRGVVRSLQLSPTNSVAQQFTMSDRGFLTQVHAALTTKDGTIKNTSKATWSIYTDVNDMPGTKMPMQRFDEDNELITIDNGVIPVSLIDGGLSDPAFDVFVDLVPGKYWLVFTNDDDDDTLIYYNDVPSTQEKGELKVQNGEQAPWASIDTEDGIHFELSIRIVRRDEYHYLTAPGIYSLVGERYIVMRCPEIEENSYRSLAYTGNCLGLAKFQLGVVGYSENRLDFSKVPTREFHPIGKLQKLTLRFETATGKLYDFKGVNHNITFAIHYYEPNAVQHFEQSILNPNYNADILRYMYRQDEQEQESDDQDYEYDQDDLSEYRQQESRHLPQNVGRLNYEALYRMNQLELEDEDEESDG